MMQISGSIYNSLKLMKLGIKWQQRKADPTKPKEDEEDPQRAQLEKHLQDQLESTNKSNILAAIDGKLKAGGELTKEELEYLKVHNPKLYEEAMEIKREREAYKHALKNCKTKDEVERLNTNKLNQFLGEAKAIRNNPNLPKGVKVAQLEKILRRVMGIQTEHNRFIQSKAYQDLPREEELREEKEKKKDTKEISYEMFCQGLSLEEIAQIRELVPGTIANHLEYYVRLGKIKLEEIVAEDHIQKIRHYLETHEFSGLVAIKAALGDDVSYSDIKLVLAATTPD